MTVTVIDIMDVCATKTDIRVDQSILKRNAALGAAMLLYIRRCCVHQQNDWSLYLCIKAMSLNTQRFFKLIILILYYNNILRTNKTRPYSYLHSVAYIFTK